MNSIQIWRGCGFKHLHCFCPVTVPQVLEHAKTLTEGCGPERDSGPAASSDLCSNVPMRFREEAMEFNSITQLSIDAVD